MKKITVKIKVENGLFKLGNLHFLLNKIFTHSKHTKNAYLIFKYLKYPFKGQLGSYQSDQMLKKVAQIFPKVDQNYPQ